VLDTENKYLVDNSLTRLYNKITRCIIGGEMARRKYPSELNNKHVRVGLGDYALLAEISRRASVTMAEALHLVIEQHGQSTTKVSPAQIPMPVYRVTPQVTIAVNGAGVEHSVFKIKPKGGVIHE